jgi:ATP-binding protein involved in chromosome partitioning
MSAPAPTLDEAVTVALANVQDPEIRRPITELGMVKSVSVGPDGVAHIGILLTVSGCPLKDKLRTDIPPRPRRWPASPAWTSTSGR